MNDLITQAIQPIGVSTQISIYEEGPGTLITLDLRGKRFVMEREELISLPESILLCLFPNGWIANEGEEGEPVCVDVSHKISGAVQTWG